MSHCLFETFCETIDGFPPKAVLKAVAIERFMLEEDLAQGRTLPSDDSASILTFCRFLEGTALGWLVLPRTIPMGQWMFYIKIVEQLVAARELPREAKEEFEAAKHDVFSRILA